MRDRREVLKLLAGGTAAAAGASLITSNTVFADGGTPRNAPACSTASAVSFNTTTTNNRIVLTIAQGTTTCRTGFTAATAYAIRVTNGLVAYTGGSTVIASGGNYSSFATLSTSATVTIGTPGPGDLSNNTAVAVDVIIRRTCTQNSNTTRKSWCCVRYSRSATYSRGSTDEWPSGTTTGSFGTGTGSISSGNGCTAP